MRTCKKCDEEKELNEFVKCKEYFLHTCRKCNAKHRKEKKKKIKLGLIEKQQDHFTIHVGDSFGRLTAIKYLGKIYKGEKKEKRTKSRSTWLVRCRCNGKLFSILSNSLTSGHSKSCGCLESESKRERGKKQVGENHPLFGLRGKDSPIWKHDMTDEERESNRSRMYQPEYREWASAVLKRDKNTCQLSDIKNPKRFKKFLVCHHLESWLSNKELRFEVSNGIVLQIEIHKLFHKLYGSGDNTRIQFEEFSNRYKLGEFNEYLKAKWAAPLENATQIELNF